MNSQSGLLYVEKILYTTLVNGGVTTARDIGGATDFIKRMINDNMMISPRLKIAIAMLSTTGGMLILEDQIGVMQSYLIFLERLLECLVVLLMAVGVP